MTSIGWGGSRTRAHENSTANQDLATEHYRSQAATILQQLGAASSATDFLVCYDGGGRYNPAITAAFWVSNYDACNPSQGAGRQSLSKLSSDGTVAVLHWISGLNSPTGPAVRNVWLYAVERTGLNDLHLPRACQRNVCSQSGITGGDPQ